VSPDGRRIAYVSAETGVPELFVRPFRSGGRAVRLTTGGARSPRWRRDGREFYHQTADGRLMATAVPASSDLTAAVAAPLFRAPTYQRDMFLDQGTNCDVMPDGQEFVVRLPASDNLAVLVQHWPSMLGAK